MNEKQKPQEEKKVKWGEMESEADAWLRRTEEAIQNAEEFYAELRVKGSAK